MKLGSKFVVPADRDKVFAFFFDPEMMRVCLPGCEELRQVDDTHYAGTLVNEVSHVKFKAGFTAEILSAADPPSSDEPAVVKALLRGRDRRLGSTVKVDATVTVEGRGDESLVTYEFDLAMWGKLGRLGEPVVRRRSIEVQEQFAEALAAVCAGRPVPDTAGGHRPNTPSSPVGNAQESSGAVGAPTVRAQPEPAVTASPPATSSAVSSPCAPPARDVPFVVAVATAALATGVIIGNRWRHP